MKKFCGLALVLALLCSMLTACDGSSLFGQNNEPTATPNGGVVPYTPEIPTPSQPPASGNFQLDATSTAEPVVADTPTPVPDTVQADPTELPTVTPVQSATNNTTAATPIVKTTVPVIKTAAPAKSTKPAVTPTPKPTLGPTFTAVPAQPGQAYNGPLSEVVRGRTGKRQVAITLDAGADGSAFPKIGAALSQYNTHLTFFLTGQWIQQNPVFTQQIVAGGNEIANHSWDHPDFTTISDERAVQEIQKTDELISRFTGHSPKPLWRFPYGSRNAHLMQLVNGMGYRSIFWTIDSLDSVGQPKSTQFLVDRVTKQSDAQLDGEIILMHVGNNTTAEALPVILQNLQSRGFQIVPISKLLS